jgi:TetR/AcrR family transcriptional repressor of bet genes
MPETEATGQRPRKERKDNADRRRLQLIEATLRSVVANGLAKTTLATVATEAGLSQGVAVFYFKTKDVLLAAALSHQYARYEEAWTAQLDQAGVHPADRMTALIHADFAPEVCNPEALAIWFAFWGEARFRPRYAETSHEFDDRRAREIARICSELMPGASEAEVHATAISIDSLTDGFWQRMYLSPDSFSRVDAVATTFRLLRILFPDHAARFSPG